LLTEKPPSRPKKIESNKKKKSMKKNGVNQRNTKHRLMSARTYSHSFMVLNQKMLKLPRVKTIMTGMQLTKNRSQVTGKKEKMHVLDNKKNDWEKVFNQVRKKIKRRIRKTRVKPNQKTQNLP